MLQHLKRLANQVMIYGLGDTVNKIATLLTLPIFSHFLSPADYGVASVLTVTNALVMGLADLGLTNGIFRFFHEEKSEKRYRLISTAQLAMVGLSLGLALIALPFASQISSLFFKSPDFGYLVSLNFFTIPLTLITTAPLMRLRMEEKPKIYTFITASRVIIGILLNVFLVVFLKRGINGLFEGPFLLAIIYGLVVGFYSLKDSGIAFSRTLFNKMFKFGFPFILALLTFWVMDWADRFLLSRMTNLSEVGLYTLGYTIGMGIMLPVGAFATAWPPFFMSVSKEKNAPEIYAKIFTYYSLAIGFLSLLIIFYAPDYFRFFTPSEYRYAYTVVPLITLSYALKGNFLIICVGSLLIKKPFLQFYSEIIAMALNIAAMLVLIPIMGRMGAAWATLIAYVALPVSLYLFSNNLYKVKYEVERVFRILIIGLGVYFLAKYLYEPTNLNMVIRFGILLLYPILLYLTGFFDKNELGFLRSIKVKIFSLKSVNK